MRLRYWVYFLRMTVGPRRWSRHGLARLSPLHSCHPSPHSPVYRLYLEGRADCSVQRCNLDVASICPVVLFSYSIIFRYFIGCLYAFGFKILVKIFFLSRNPELHWILKAISDTYTDELSCVLIPLYHDIGHNCNMCNKNSENLA